MNKKEKNRQTMHAQHCYSDFCLPYETHAYMSSIQQRHSLPQYHEYKLDIVRLENVDYCCYYCHRHRNPHFGEYLRVLWVCYHCHHQDHSFHSAPEVYNLLHYCYCCCGCYRYCYRMEEENCRHNSVTSTVEYLVTKQTSFLVEAFRRSEGVQRKQSNNLRFGDIQH